jgi:glycosyltransferase involved in cell wall biosynthesis
LKCTTVITSYNRKNYIERAIDSALRELPENEIIIVDDASTDGTISWIQDCYAHEISSGLISIESLLENIGVTGAKNHGYVKAKGRWVIFLDSDDYYDSNVGKLILDDLESSAEQPIIFFRCRTQAGTFIGTKKHSILEIELRTYLKDGSYGEALTAFNKGMIGVLPPYISELRGYEGIGCAQIIKKYGPARLSKVIARVYVLDGKDRISNGKLFITRMPLISIGHIKMIKEFWREMSFSQVLLLGGKSFFYLIIGQLFIQLIKKK